MSQVLRQVLGNSFPLAVLSGPSFALEVARGHPTAVSVASDREEIAEGIQHVFSTKRFRVYISDDVIGLELGGSLKNVIAIAAGISDGLGYGTNTRAALITRGLAEISRLAINMGGNPLTLSGLGGMGDLVLTCTGDLSRNRQVGLKLGQGLSISQILSEMRMVAEGVKTAESAYALAKKHGVEMPITSAVYGILNLGKNPKDAVFDLMTRDLKREID
jgi:glycerol-3-phosphate dehydrogenase (NAD(P)+)